jgi:Flp pilus assembly pilin Flp
VILSIFRRCNHWARDDTAATATEYAVMLALILAVILTSVTLFGQNLDAKYEDIDSTLFGS